jgi:pyridoxine 5'-phosphate synthase PdxJ
MSSELNYLPLVIRFFADENMEVVIDERLRRNLCSIFHPSRILLLPPTRNTFHGKGNFDYMIQKVLLQQGHQALHDALRHPLICIDPGNINGGCVICGELVRTWTGKYRLHIKFTRFLFRNNDRYTLIEDIA